MIPPLPSPKGEDKGEGFLLRGLAYSKDGIHLSTPHLSPLLITPVLALTGASRPSLPQGESDEATVSARSGAEKALNTYLAGDGIVCNDGTLELIA
jgi:hypothetical protein